METEESREVELVKEFLRVRETERSLFHFGIDSKLYYTKFILVNFLF